MRLTHLIAAAAAVTLAACGGGASDDAAGDAAPEPSAAVSFPVPTASESTDMVAALDAIVPGLADDPDTAMDFARSTCSALLGGVSEKTLVHGTERYWYVKQADLLTKDQTDEVVAAVKGSTWCS